MEYISIQVDEITIFVIKDKGYITILIRERKKQGTTSLGDMYLRFEINACRALARLLLLAGFALTTLNKYLDTCNPVGYPSLLYAHGSIF